MVCDYCGAVKPGPHCAECGEWPEGYPWWISVGGLLVAVALAFAVLTA